MGGLYYIHGYIKWKLSSTKVAKYYHGGMYCVYGYTEWKIYMRIEKRNYTYIQVNQGVYTYI